MRSLVLLLSHARVANRCTTISSNSSVFLFAIEHFLDKKKAPRPFPDSATSSAHVLDYNHAWYPLLTNALYGRKGAFLFSVFSFLHSSGYLFIFRSAISGQRIANEQTPLRGGEYVPRMCASVQGRRPNTPSKSRVRALVAHCPLIAKTFPARW